MLKAAKSDDQEDKFNTLGFGFTAYLGLVHKMIGMFIVLTIVMLPTLIIYS